jgi:hypothetical protein
MFPFTLEWLKRQQERDPEHHWYQSTCTCENCCEVRQTVTVPSEPTGRERKRKKSK